MTTDKMRHEFEAWAKAYGFSLFPMKGSTGHYWNDDTNFAWQTWQAAYAAGQKAEREEKDNSKNVKPFHNPATPSDYETMHDYMEPEGER